MMTMILLNPKAYTLKDVYNIVETLNLESDNYEIKPCPHGCTPIKPLFVHLMLVAPYTSCPAG